MLDSTPSLKLQPLPGWSSDRTWATFPREEFHQDFRGSELQKTEDDLLRYSDLIEASQPDIVVEVGTRAGGSARWFHDQMGLKVFTIDIDPRIDSKHDLTGITSIKADSRDLMMAAGLIKELRADTGARVMVSLDGDHHADTVEVEIALWADAVTPGCYLVIEDACFDLWDDERARVGGAQIPERGGPLHAINRCAGVLSSRGFWRDVALEDLTSISHSPVGWWRKGD